MGRRSRFLAALEPKSETLKTFLGFHATIAGIYREP